MRLRPGIELANLTDVGCVRERNEDYYGYAEPEDDAAFEKKGRLAIVADGMGGHEGGEIASGIAVDTVRSVYFSESVGEPHAALMAAFREAHERIQEFAGDHPNLRGMGTTCTAAAIRDHQLFYGHVGDSRLYLIRDGSISQVTEDHSLVNRMVRQGLIRPEEAASHPDRNVLTSALGTEGRVSADFADDPVALKRGDILLICSDGLHTAVSDQEMLNLAIGNRPRERLPAVGGDGEGTGRAGQHYVADSPDHGRLVRRLHQAAGRSTFAGFNAMIGKQLGSYRIEEKLGEGGMGVVYRGIDTFLERPVAIKVLSPQYAENQELLARFKGEARAQANLNHTNIATLYAFLVEGDQAWMVMEFIDGESIAQILERRGLIPPGDAVPLFRQALLGLGQAHRLGIIHRDLKPGNLMVNRSGIVKVMDFGIAKVAGTRGMTRTGVQVGTLHYMSPEQVKSKQVDIRSDIYSLGATLYEMLTAHVPFDRSSEYEIFFAHLNTPPERPTRYYPYIPKGIENAVLKALEKNPDDRFQTVEEFGAALEHPDTYDYVPTWESAAKTAPEAPTEHAMHSIAAITNVPIAGTVVQPGTAAGWVPPEPQPVPPQPQSPAGAVPPNRAWLSTTGGRVVAASAVAVVLVGLAIAVFHKPRPVIPDQPIASAVTPPSSIGGASSTAAEHVIAPPESDVPPPAPTPAVNSVDFGVNVSRITAGQSARLSWRVARAVEVRIFPDVGTVQPNGMVTVSPQRSMEYSLVARLVGGETVTRKAVIEVEPAAQKPQPTPPAPQPAPPAPAPPVAVRPTVTFDAQPAQIQAGGMAILRWSVANAQSAFIIPEPGALQQNAGVYRVSPQATTTYTLTARGADGSTVTASATVNVMPAVRAGTPFRVVHDHGGIIQGPVWASCYGILQVTGSHIRYTVTGSTDGRNDGFDFPLDELDEVKINRAPIRGQRAFHLKSHGISMNFVPLGVSSEQVVIELGRETGR